jgi:hypothetical protein
VLPSPVVLLSFEVDLEPIYHVQEVVVEVAPSPFVLFLVVVLQLQLWPGQSLLLSPLVRPINVN